MSVAGPSLTCPHTRRMAMQQYSFSRLSEWRGIGSLRGLVPLAQLAEVLEISPKGIETIALEGHFLTLIRIGNSDVLVVELEEVLRLVDDADFQLDVTRQRRRPQKCPNCGEQRWIPIVFGMPGPELWE